jgi:transcriptional regulator with XRE-family HTH domain
MALNNLSRNIKHLRKLKGWSQDDLAKRMQISRSAVSAYEIGTAEPNIALLIRLSDDFQLPIDDLIRRPLHQLSGDDIAKRQKGPEVDIKGARLRVLATTVSDDDEPRIELVPARARAGYTSGYADPDFLRELPRLELPFLPRNRTYRAFYIHGDSMPPIPDGAMVVGEYLDDWTHIKDTERYVVVSRDDGIVLKYITGDWQKNGQLTLSSSNPSYEPYTIDVHDVLEIWRFTHLISNGEATDSDANWSDAFRHIKAELSELRRIIDKNP